MDYSDMDKKTLIKILKQRDETLKKLKYHIKRDYMTGVFNRREGAHILEQEINYSKTNKESFVICFVDVDRLKDRKSTRLNSSHANISYAVFCLKKKK